MIYFDIPVLNLRFRGRFAGRDWSHSWESYDSWIDSRTAIGALPGKCPTPGLKDVPGGPKQPKIGSPGRFPRRCPTPSLKEVPGGPREGLQEGPQKQHICETGGPKLVYCNVNNNETIICIQKHMGKSVFFEFMFIFTLQYASFGPPFSKTGTFRSSTFLVKISIF
jgi:hypothetical protein